VLKIQKNTIHIRSIWGIHEAKREKEWKIKES